MLMQYWQNESSNVIYGFDISDPKQVQAMSQLINVGQWTMLSEVSEFVVSTEQNKQLAIWYLQETDWVNEPDVYDVTQPIYLLNRQEFINYRTQIRSIAINPTSGDLTWPIMPVAHWSS